MQALLHRTSAGPWLAAFSYALLLWTFRRFGLLAGATLMIVSALITVVPPVIPSWWSGRVLFLHAIPVAVGLWALWVILSSSQAPLDRIRRVTGDRQPQTPEQGRGP